MWQWYFNCSRLECSGQYGNHHATTVVQTSYNFGHDNLKYRPKNENNKIKVKVKITTNCHPNSNRKKVEKCKVSE